MKFLKGSAAALMLLLLSGTPLMGQTITPQVSTGNHHSLVLTEKGEVYGFGRNDLGALGLGNTNRIDIPGIVSHPNLAGKTIADVEMGYDGNHILILTTDGQVYSMGDNSYGQCGYPTTQSYISEPTRITQSGLDTVIVRDIAVGTRNSLLATNHGIYVFGDNENRYLGTGSVVDIISTPTRLTQTNVDMVPFKFIETSSTGTTYAIADNDSLFVWGRNSNGELGLGDFTGRTNPELLSKSRFGGQKVTKFSIDEFAVLALTEDGKAYFWGYRLRTAFEGTSDLSRAITTPALVNHESVAGKTIIDVALSINIGLLVASDGSVFTFGNNNLGQLGLGDFVLRRVPTAVNNAFFQGKTITKVFASQFRSYFLASDGTAFVAGGTDLLGSGYSNFALTPLPVNRELIPGETIAKVSTKWNGQTNYAVTTSGKLLSWDRTYYYYGLYTELLLRDRPIFSQPTRLPLSNLTGKTVSKVRAGDHKSFLLTTDGNVYGTGQASLGGLGTTDSLDVFDPVLLDQTHISGKKIIEVATSGNGNFAAGSIIRSHTLLLADDGTIYGFGSNNNGQLGLGDNINRRIPTPITTNLDGKTIIHIAVGPENSMAIASDGSVYLWGKGGLGEMGFGNTNDLNVPTLATHLTSLGKTFVKGAIGSKTSGLEYFPHFILLASDGTVYSFGENSDGQLGLNNRTDTYTPTQITATSISGKKIIDVSASIDGATMLLAETGEVYGFGQSNRVGFATGNLTDYLIPTLVNSAEVTGRRVSDMSVFGYHSMLLMQDGRVLTAVPNINLSSREGVLGNMTVPDETRLHLPIQDFTTYASPIPTGNLKLHLDAGRLGFITANDSVNTWSNLADANQNAFQDNLARRAVVLDSAINNLPALRFNGTNSYVTLPTAADLGIQNSDYELFFIAKSRVSTTNVHFLLGSDALEQYELHLNGAAGSRFIPNAGKYVDVGTAGDYTNTEAQVFNVRASDTEGVMSVNRNQTVHAGSARSSLAGHLYLGVRADNSFTFYGDMAEVIIYNKVLSPAERGAVESYLFKKYAIQNYKESSGRLTGTEGWRLLASPVADSSFAPLLKPFWTQGFTGAKFEGGTPNVYVWPDTASTNAATNWKPVTNMADSLKPGQGVLVYVFSDDNGPGVEGDAGFPKNFSLEGREPDTDQTLTPLLNKKTNGWALLGNPYRTDIDWEGFTKTGMSNSVYVYDHNAAGWKSWNGSVGTLSEGKVGAFNAFFVQTLSANPTLTIPRSAKTDSTTRFLGKMVADQQAPMGFSVQLHSEHGLENAAWCQFSEQGAEGIDATDAYQLTPLTTSYTLLASRMDDNTLLDINHLPIDKTERVIPLYVESTEAGLHHLSLNRGSLPADWEVYLLDHATGAEIELSSPYEFQEQPAKAKRAEISPTSLKEPVLKAKAGNATRFSLLVKTGTLSSQEAEGELPRDFGLSQNYPNPFNPSTMIRYQLPVRSRVTLQVFDVLGREVATLVNGQIEAGYHQVPFDASNLASGMYIYRLQAGNQVFTKKLTLIK